MRSFVLASRYQAVEARACLGVHVEVCFRDVRYRLGQFYAPRTVKLKGKGTPMASSEDVDGDGILDLVVHVSTDALELTDGDSEAVLEGQTLDGILITGVDTIRVVP